MKAIKAIYNGIDKFNDILGRVFSVLVLGILGVILCEVVLRRIFNRPQIWTQDLTRMYSFGRRHPYNPFWGGFVIESPHAGTFRRFSDTTAVILAVEITEERYAALEATLETMWARREQFSYNLGGLLLAYFRILWKRSNRYYCSEFVEDMLLHAEVRGAGELRTRVVQPIHFLKLPHTRLYAGRLRDYPHCTASR